MVASRTGSASAPPRILRPSTPTEKSPDTGFTPEYRPGTEVTKAPESLAARSSPAVPGPGAAPGAVAHARGHDATPRRADPEGPGADVRAGCRGVRNPWTTPQPHSQAR